MTEVRARSITCPGCGAPVDPRGSRVRILVCAYCGIVMDVRTSEAAGGRSRQRKIKTILRPGMAGNVDGEVLTVVGLARCYAEDTAWDTAFLLGEDEGRGVVVRSQAGRYEQMIPLARDRVAPVDPGSASVRVDGVDIQVRRRVEARVSYLEGQLMLALRKDRPLWSLEAGTHRVEWTEGDYRAYEVRPLSHEAICRAFGIGGSRRRSRPGRAAPPPRPPPQPRPVPRRPSVAGRLVSVAAVGGVVLMMGLGAVASALVSATAGMSQAVGTPAVPAPVDPAPEPAPAVRPPTSNGSSPSAGGSSSTSSRTQTPAEASGRSDDETVRKGRPTAGARPTRGANRRPGGRHSHGK